MIPCISLKEKSDEPDITDRFWHHQHARFRIFASEEHRTHIEDKAQKHQNSHQILSVTKGKVIDRKDSDNDKRDIAVDMPAVFPVLFSEPVILREKTKADADDRHDQY